MDDATVIILTTIASHQPQGVTAADLAAELEVSLSALQSALLRCPLNVTVTGGRQRNQT